MIGCDKICARVEKSDFSLGLGYHRKMVGFCMKKVGGGVNFFQNLGCGVPRFLQGVKGG